jgi:hypothetical protein
MVSHSIGIVGVIYEVRKFGGCQVKVWQLKTRCPLRNLCEVMVSKAEVKVTSFEKLKL